MAAAKTTLVVTILWFIVCLLSMSTSFFDLVHVLVSCVLGQILVG